MTGKLCDYGCGRQAIYTFKNGKNCCCKHNQQCPSIRKKNSEGTTGHKGRSFSIEERKQASKKFKSLWKDPKSKFNTEEYRNKIKNFGEHNGFYKGEFTTEQLNKIKDGNRIAWKNPLSTFNSKEYRDLLKKRQKEFRSSIKGKLLSSNAARKRWSDENEKKKHSETIKEKWNIGCYTNNRTPSGRKTKPEIQLQEILDLLFPEKYRYTGDHSFWVGRKNPDFKMNHKKKVIEVFGVYWHGKEMTKVCNLQHELDYLSYYRKYGYDCLIIWENESKSSIINKLQDFQGIT